MKKENKLNENNQNKKQINIIDKNNLNNEKDNCMKKNLNEKKEILDDPEFDINTFCPDPDAIEKKIRSHTVRQSVKKGKMKKFIEEGKSNKIDQKKYLKTPQVMVPKLRPQKRSLNPTPLRLNPFSLKSSKLNVINEENIILSEHEEESENLESSSFSSDENENKNEEKYDTDEEKIEEEVKEEEEKNEEESEEKEKKEEVKNEEGKEEKINNKPNIGFGILGCLIKGKNNEKEEEKEKEKKINENKIEENKNENEIISLKEFRKNMKEENKTFKKKNKDLFNLIDSNIKNNYNKFKEDVLAEEKNDNNNIINNKNNHINDKIKSNCCPILDFYIKNSSILKSKI